MKQTITVTQTIIEEKEIEFPFYSRNKSSSNFYAAFDEKTMFEIYFGVASTVWIDNDYSSKDTVFGGVEITADEFNEAAKKAHDLMNQSFSKISMLQMDAANNPTPSEIADAKRDNEIEMSDNEVEPLQITEQE